MITTAIIPVAGWGSRRLPITKAIEKCMLPIGNRPLVDYVVQDCIAAGITDIIFVVSEGSEQLQRYYGHNQALEQYVKERGKTELLQRIQPPAVNFRYITQPEGGAYGTAVPVALAADYITEGESAVVLMGDDFIYHSDGSSEVARLIADTPAGGCGLLAASVPHQEVSSYGVLAVDEAGNYQKIVEKPVADEAPSNLINISKYLLTKQVIDSCRQLKPSPRGEYELPDAINNYVATGGQVRVVPAAGQYLDGGTLEGWLHANQVVCAEV